VGFEPQKYSLILAVNVYSHDFSKQVVSLCEKFDYLTTKVIITCYTIRSKIILIKQYAKFFSIEFKLYNAWEP